jgi:hypothetical protein
MKLKKKLKKIKKNQSQSILIFETRDCDLEAKTDLIKGKSKKTMKQDLKKNMLSDENEKKYN